ncbi:MAG: hypothetical protein IT310_09510, partial [Anaerolineales bacterium]|nr:hypothetical protein [Anaerolineales bacterium]
MPENGAESHPSSARFVGGFAQDVLINNQNHNHKTDKIIARILLFSKNQKTMPCVSAGSTTTKTLAEKDSAKQTRTIILGN